MDIEGSFDLVGRTLAGRYELREVLGRGGMATVYRAYQPGLDRFVAVKVIAANLAHDPDFIERFRREARTVARLRHPNILTVHDFGEEGGLLYLVTELIAGGTLQARLPEIRTAERACALLAQVGAALDFAHAQGIVHRDVKPLNIFLADDRAEQAILADFGIAKATVEATGASLTGTGLSIGTPEYMAPEQLIGQSIDGRADLYALAVIAYQLLVGRLPFTRGGPPDTPIALAMRKVQGLPPAPSSFNPSFPAAGDAVLLRALATDPRDRYATAAEFVAALRAALAAPAVHGAQTLVAPQPTAWPLPTPANTPYPGVYPGGMPNSLPRLATSPSIATGPQAAVTTALPVAPSQRTWVPFAGGLAVALLACVLAVAVWRGVVVRDAGGGAATATAPAGTVIAVASNPPAGVVVITPTSGPTTGPTNMPPATATPPPTATMAPTVTPTATANVQLGAPTPQVPPTTAPAATVVREAQSPPTPTPTATPVPPTPTPVPPMPTPVPPPTPTRVPTATTAPRRTDPAAGQLLYASNKERYWAIYLLRLDGSAERRLTDLNADNYSANWSPDGRQIVFVSERDGNAEIYTMNADGTGAKRLTQQAGKDNSPIWSPDGQKIAFVSFRDYPDGAIYLMNRDSTNLVRLVNTPSGAPAWSVRGDIVFARSVNKVLSLFTTTLNASGVKQLTPTGGADDDSPSFSPDGGQLALSAGPSQQNRQIAVINADGSGRRFLTALQGDTSNPVWSGDGGWIAYASDRSGTFQIYIMRADGSDERQITTGVGKKWYLSWR